jgi:hypothetical protein
MAEKRGRERGRKNQRERGKEGPGREGRSFFVAHLPNASVRFIMAPSLASCIFSTNLSLPSFVFGVMILRLSCFALPCKSG